LIPGAAGGVAGTPNVVLPVPTEVESPDALHRAPVRPDRLRCYT
jgi:hypothetical protein